MPELEPARDGQPADAGDDGKVCALHRDDQEPLRHPVRRDSAREHERDEAHTAGGRHEGELQRAAAQMDHLIDHRHGPHPGAENGDGQGRYQHPVFPVRERAEGPQ
jgi:hypothetical protein